MDCPLPVFSGNFPSRFPNTENASGNGGNGGALLCFALKLQKNTPKHAKYEEILLITSENGMKFYVFTLFACKFKLYLPVRRCFR